MATTTTASSGENVRIAPRVLAAMRRALRELPPETHPERELHRRLKAVATVDPADRLGLSGPGDTDRLNKKVSDGGPLTHESKQDANPPFAAPLG